MRTRTTTIAVLLLAATLGACGGDEKTGPQAAPKAANGPSAPAPPGELLTVKALRSGSGAYRYDTKRLKAKAGRITITFVNGDTFPHNVRVQTAGSKCCFGPDNKDVGGTSTIDGGSQAKTTLTLEPGRYMFLCSINGHWNSVTGKMRGTLVVS
jgi:plastocyanin